jgi:curved DNA-binding protein
MMEYKDYYKILGLPRTASAAEVKKAYRRLAHEFHPDRNNGSKSAEAKFKALNEANAVLSNPARRAEYDALDPDLERAVRERAAQNPFYGNAPDPFGRPTAAGTTPGGVRYQFSSDEADTDFSDFFRLFFGPQAEWAGDPAPGVRQRAPAPSAPRARARNKSVEISLAEVALGTSRLLTVGGRRLEVKIPAGVDTGSRIRLAGVGTGAEDVHLIIKVSAHPLFTRDGADLSAELPLTLAEALLGAEVEVGTLLGRILLKIPAGTQQDQIFRLSGQGLPKLRSSVKGDLYVRAKIILPSKLDERARAAAVDFLALTPQANPRPRT